MFPPVPTHLKNNNKVVRDTYDDRCLVCGYDDYEENNKILYCDGCDIGLH
jgi:uncharacterized membrane protein